MDKAGDLLEECGGAPPSHVLTGGGGGLKDLARNLRQHLRGFSERLEDTRERLEDTSRCYYLLDRVSVAAYYSVSAGQGEWQSGKKAELNALSTDRY